MKITLEEVHQLVTFKQSDKGLWEITSVRGNVYGDVKGLLRVMSMVILKEM